MLKFLNTNQKNFSKKLELILNLRKSKQKYKSATVKKILLDLKKKGDKAVIKYEKKFSKIKTEKRLNNLLDKISSANLKTK